MRWRVADQRQRQRQRRRDWNMHALRRKYGIILTSLAMLSVLSGCGSATVVADCSWYGMIRTSVDDVLTRETADQIIVHNMTVAALCRDA